MPSAIGGVAQGIGQVEAANLQSKGALKQQESADAASAARANAAFQAQTGYIDQKNTQLRGAMQGIGNPAMEAGGMLRPPQSTPMNSQPTTGGQRFSGGMGGSGAPQAGGGGKGPGQISPGMLQQAWQQVGGQQSAPSSAGPSAPSAPAPPPMLRPNPPQIGPPSLRGDTGGLLRAPQ
ncbi:MAG: hypothetical protein NVS1B6_19940 [Steroidobacteraceae bacterium]